MMSFNQLGTNSESASEKSETQAYKTRVAVKTATSRVFGSSESEKKIHLSQNLIRWRNDATRMCTL